MTKLSLRFLTLILALGGLCALLGGCGNSELGPSDLQDSAVRRALDRQCYRWDGTLSIQKEAGGIDTFPLTYELSQDEFGYVGELTFELQQSATRKELVAVPVVFEMNEEGWWTGSVGATTNLMGRVALRSPSTGADPPKLDKRTVSWAGPEHGFHMSLSGDASMQLSVDGLVPLPDGLDADAVWVAARLQREGFRLVIGPFNIVLMEFLGVFATLFFASRFVIQWIASEKAKRSVIPEVFWWVSLVGAGLMIAYAVYFGRFAVLLGQTMGWIVYLRNIWLIEREKHRLRIQHHAESDLDETTAGSENRI